MNERGCPNPPTGSAATALEKAFKAAFADKKLAKAAKDLLAVRIDTGDEEAAKKLGLSPAKTPRLDVLDGYGLLAGSRDGKTTPELVASLLQKAEETTKKKKKVEKAMDALVAKGETALKNDDTRAACEIFLGVLEHEKDVPCKASAAAHKHLDELAAKGAELLAKAREAMDKQDFAAGQQGDRGGTGPLSPPLRQRGGEEAQGRALGGRGRAEVTVLQAIRTELQRG